MAVREVFTPEVAAKFGQFEDFPPNFADFAGQQGISEEWAQRYWAAHWALPSPQQGFEMLQRRIPGTDKKIIDREELNLLLRALDVMPFWREKLTNIAYRPITRVDIRRMNSLGLIDLDEVQKRYEDLGFAPADAALMTQFTAAFNKTGDFAEAGELEGITRAMIVKLYKQGAFTEQQTRKALQAIGLGDNAVTIIIESANVELEIARREDLTSIIIEQVKAGQLTFEQGFDRLSSLGLEPTELLTAQSKLERVRVSKTKLPSLGDLTKMFQKKIINRVEYLLELERLGYSTVWATRYLQLAELE